MAVDSAVVVETELVGDITVVVRVGLVEGIEVKFAMLLNEDPDAGPIIIVEVTATTAVEEPIVIVELKTTCEVSTVVVWDEVIDAVPDTVVVEFKVITVISSEKVLVVGAGAIVEVLITVVVECTVTTVSSSEEVLVVGTGALVEVDVTAFEVP